MHIELGALMIKVTDGISMHIYQRRRSNHTRQWGRERSKYIHMNGPWRKPLPYRGFTFKQNIYLSYPLEGKEVRLFGRRVSWMEGKKERLGWKGDPQNCVIVLLHCWNLGWPATACLLLLQQIVAVLVLEWPALYIFTTSKIRGITG